MDFIKFMITDIVTDPLTWVVAFLILTVWTWAFIRGYHRGDE